MEGPEGHSKPVQPIPVFTTGDQAARSDTTPQISPDIAFLSRFGIECSFLLKAQERAERFDVSPCSVLLSSGVMSEFDYYRCVAFELGLEFVHEQEDPLADGVTPFFEVPSPQHMDHMAHMMAVDEKSPHSTRLLPKSYLIAPDCRQLPAIQKLLDEGPDLRERLKVTPHSANKASLLYRSSPSLLRNAIDGLRRRYPEFSAKQVVTPKQATALLIILQVVAFLAYFSSGTLLLMLHLIATSFYVGCIGLRLWAALTFKAFERIDRTHPNGSSRVLDHQFPMYTILVAVYQEALQIDDLVTALLNLDWPKERLEIKIICEGDDRETIHAVESALQRERQSHISLVEVPASVPRTKPKALNYALPLCKGKFVVIYDAEDRPSPLQLREAYAAFVDGSPELACVQAPLVVLNNRESWLSSLFSIEYSALFDGLLPALSGAKVPVPLGGTSNHFKREVLVNIGAWDPYNVTEDADLGTRLARAGCVVGTLTRPTFEEAPVTFNVWLKQRTRWFKGWYQTWLVHTRHPIVLFRDLGFKGTLIFHLLMSGMAVSALVHPLLVYFVFKKLIEMVSSGLTVTLYEPLFLLDLATITLGYASFAALAWLTLPVRNLSHLRSWLWTIPAYWMLLSIAAWRALWHLISRPHEWEKTPHRLKLRSPTG